VFFARDLYNLKAKIPNASRKIAFVNDRGKEMKRVSLLQKRL
jgi:hypothetical protein